MEVDKSLLRKPEQLQLLINILLESSEQCPENMLDAEPHPSHQTLAMFANLVYSNKMSGELAAAHGTGTVSGKLDGWRLLMVGTNTGWKNGYVGAAFAHTGSQQIVVAHRGTDPSSFGALYTDIRGIGLTKYTNCMNSAVTFVDLIRQVINSANNQHRHYTLAITGHSLGAWLAQITSFSVKYLAISQDRLEMKPEVGIHAKTVGFDSPGARDMLDQILDDYYERYAMNAFLDGLDITLYLSAPNHINTCGMHLGKIYRVFIDISSFNIIDTCTIKYTIATHAMSNFVDAFVDEKRKIVEVSDWAKNIEELKELFKILKWANNYHGHAEVDDPDYLLEKIHRCKVVELESSRNVESFKSSFRVFSEDELQMLYKLHILQEQKSELAILHEFTKKNMPNVKTIQLFPDFDIDLYNRVITCKSEESSMQLCKHLKQLMRWLKPQFKQVLHNQIKFFLYAADFIYYAEGQSNLDSLPKCWLDFADFVGFRDFLDSGNERVLCIVTNSGDGAFLMSRLWNILNQIKRSVDSSDRFRKYTSENHYTFLGWPQLQRLTQIYGWPIDKEYMLVVDSTSASFTLEDRTALVNYACSNSMKLILISSQPIDTPDSFEFIKNINPDCIVHLTDLTDDSQKKIFERDNVIISGNKAYSFRQFLGSDCSVHEIDQILSSGSLKNFATIEDYAIHIKDTRPRISDLHMPFLIVNIKTSMEFLVRCVETPDTNILVVINGLSREELETGDRWEQLAGKAIILTEGDTELLFKDICTRYRHNIIYLLEVSGEDIYCTQIYDERFYLPRKFLHRIRIDVRSFTTKHAEDLFVIRSGKDKTSLLGLIKNRMDGEKFLKIAQIAATKEQEENIIQKSNNKNIHFVEFSQCEGSYEIEWRYSHGSVENLRPHVSTNSFEPIDERTLSQTERNLVIITDEPGMGKTTSLARLSTLVKSPWVIHIDFKQFKEDVTRLPEVLAAHNVASFLLREYCSRADSSPAHKLLEYLLRSKVQSKKLTLMFDGFDELEDYVDDRDSANEKVVRLLIFLKNIPTVQTFLTVRKYLKESLERKLSLFSTCFDQLNRGDQREFLVKFWQSCLSPELQGPAEEEMGRLRVYAGELLREAKGVLHADMDSFMGVPLQLRMLAEVFRPQRNPLAESQELSFKPFDIVSAPKLYKRFITLKYDVYLHDKSLLGKARAVEEGIFDYINVTHMELGFKKVFSIFFDKYFVDISEEWLNAMNRQGLIESKGNGEYQFVHRTYAEYFCAQAVVHWLKPQRSHYKYPLVRDILLPRILLHPHTSIIRLFMNDALQDAEMADSAQRQNAEHISRLLLEHSDIFQNKELETALHIAVRERNEHIITFLLSRLDTVPPDAQRAFVSFITQCDINRNTALNVVDGFLSDKYFDQGILNSKRNYSYEVTNNGLPRDKIVDRAVFDRIIESIIRSIEPCSGELKERVVLATLLNRDVSKSQVSKYLQESGDTARLHERATKVLLEVSAQFFRAIHNQNLNQIKALCDQLNPSERYYIFLVKDVVRTDLYYPTVLHWAAHCGHLRVVKLLKEITLVPFEVLMAEPGRVLRTPLQVAAGRGALDVVRFLVECGADVNARNIECKSALIYAAEGGHFPTLEYLVERKADVSALDQGGQFVLLKAAQIGHLPLVKLLVERNANINFVDNGGQSALQMAAVMGHLPVVQYLVQCGAAIDSLSKAHMSAIQMAAGMGHLPVVQYLAECGAEINSISTVDPQRASQSAQHLEINSTSTVVQPAQESQCGQHPEIISTSTVNPPQARQPGQRLVINSINNPMFISLQMAAADGQLPVVQYLVQRGALLNSVDFMGRTALRKAAEGGHLLTVECLLQSDADVNIVDKRGVSALHRAAIEGHLPIVQCLVQHNAHISGVDGDGLSALHKAAQEGHYLTVEYLVEHGADIKSVGNDGLSALYRAARANHFMMVEYLIHHGAEIDSGYNTMTVLQSADVERKADINFTDEEGLPVLHSAAAMGHVPTVEYLITQRGVDIESKDGTGQSALHKAADTGEISVVRFLVENGADVNCTDGNAMTVLQVAAMGGNFETSKFLLKRGADLDKKNEKGETALTIASDFNCWRLVRLFVEKGADVNAQGGVVLSRAIQSEEWALVKYLVDKGASVCEDQVLENLSTFKVLYPDYEFKKESHHALTESCSTVGSAL